MNGVAQRILGTAFFFWLLVAGFCVWYIMHEHVRLGIDLVGGTYITVQVQTHKAIESSLIDVMQRVKKQLKNARLSKPTLAEIKPIFGNPHEATIPTSYVLELSFDSVASAQDAANVIKEQYNTMQVTTDGNIVKVSYTSNEEKKIKVDAVDRNIEVIRSRIDKLGVSETPISHRGEDTIVIELPDVSDPQQAKKIIGQAAVLEFKLVEKRGDTQDDILYEYDGDLPADLEIIPGKTVNGMVTEYFAVSRYTELTGKLLANAKAAREHENHQWIVQFSWTPEGGNLFYELTSKNHGRELAVILDGVVITYPRITASIRNDGHITGNFSDNGAKELAMLLKSGSFVAPITFEEERQVGPTLGKESIERGLLSCIVGLALIFCFAIFYYKLAGLFAFVALLFNLIIVLFGLVRLGATLTLPGIAGMVLTIGMAIDASILIFERIKEELSKGVKLKEAVKHGFSDAQWVILDGNITTFIVGLVLYHFGTGPIKGFAVTMMLGILATLITGLFFLRSIFSFILDSLHIQKLRI